MPTDLTVTLAPPKERYAFDGERASPWVRAPLWAEHLHRYLGVLHIAQGKRVLDIASGEGYGAALLHRNAAGAQVIGADVDPGIVARANRIYGTDGLRFVTASIVEPLPFDTAAFDLVTCFETIEHVGEQEAALRELRRVLAPGGVLAISTPDAAVSAKRGVKNPFHVRELEYGAFRGLLSAVFPHVGIALQRSVTGSAMTPEERMSAADPVFWWRDGFTTYHRTATLPQSAYFVAMASDRPIPSMTASFLNDGVLLGLINETVQREGFDFPPKKG